MYYDYTRYFTQIISIITDISNNLVTQIGILNHLLVFIVFAVFTALGLWCLAHSWRYKK